MAANLSRLLWEHPATQQHRAYSDISPKTEFPEKSLELFLAAILSGQSRQSPCRTMLRDTFTRSPETDLQRMPFLLIRLANLSADSRPSLSAVADNHLIIKRENTYLVPKSVPDIRSFRWLSASYLPRATILRFPDVDYRIQYCPTSVSLNLKIWFKNRTYFQPSSGAGPFGSKTARIFNQIQGQDHLVQKSHVFSTKFRGRTIWFKNRAHLHFSVSKS